LTIEPNTVFHKRPPQLPSEDALADIQQAGEALLAAAGYGQYEVSAYSRPGLRCRHNLNYWSFGDYLGIGAGAHGKITDADGRIQRYHKTRQPADYLAACSGTFTSGSRELERADIVGEFMLNALRLNEGFTRDLFEARTGLDFALIEPQLLKLQEQELIVCDHRGIRASALGRRFLDSVIAEFFSG
jgi:coproporphyrinogen III oxidase-like Fe-S oxidoreductase